MSLTPDVGIARKGNMNKCTQCGQLTQFDFSLCDVDYYEWVKTHTGLLPVLKDGKYVWSIAEATLISSSLSGAGGQPGSTV